VQGSSAGYRGSRRVAARSFVVVAALCALTGCSSGHDSDHAAGTVANVTERDFHISVSPARLPAGSVVLSVHNRGPENHELIVVRVGGDPIPLRKDGITVDEDKLKPDTIGSLGPGASGSVRELRMRLTPGRYEVFCNMSGHYLGGMHAELTVS
jgi:uncharacterized cupredoxin-like copper-binding protein